MSRWFRMYAEVLNDPKVQRLSGDDFKDWVNLLCLASQNDGRLPDLEDIAFALRRSPDGALTVLERCLNAGLIDRRSGGDSGWHYAPHGWDERQYKSDTSTERVKRFRQRSKTVSETPPDTDTDTDNNPLPPKGEDCAEFVDRWNAMASANGLSKIRGVTSDRRRKIMARLREASKEEFFAAIDAVGKSSFCKGNNQNGWKADFDFILQPKSFNKLIEGAYLNGKVKPRIGI